MINAKMETECAHEEIEWLSSYGHIGDAGIQIGKGYNDNKGKYFEDKMRVRDNKTDNDWRIQELRTR